MEASSPHDGQKPLWTSARCFACITVQAALISWWIPEVIVIAENAAGPWHGTDWEGLRCAHSCGAGTRENGYSCRRSSRAAGRSWCWKGGMVAAGRTSGSWYHWGPPRDDDMGSPLGRVLWSDIGKNKNWHLLRVDHKPLGTVLSFTHVTLFNLLWNSAKSVF